MAALDQPSSTHHLTPPALSPNQLSAPVSNVVIDEDEEVRPQRRKLGQCLREGAHLRCLLLTLIQVACLTAILWCRLSVVGRYVIDYRAIPIRRQVLTSPCGEPQLYLPLAVLAVAYVAYLVECYHCATRLQLLYKVSATTVYAYLSQMREAQPIIWWKATCYHYVRRSRQIVRYRNGDAYTTSQAYYERVNTHTSGSCFSYRGVRDVSRRLVGLEKHPTTKIRLGKGFAFASVESAQDFEEQRARFFADQGRLDDYVEMREGLDLAGCHFEEHIVTFADRLPWYVSQTGFWLLSLALLSWPLRLFIEYRTAHVHVQLTKLFGEPVHPRHHHNQQLGQLSLLSASNPSMSSPDTIENHIFEPMSYSEALLCPSIPGATTAGQILSSEEDQSFHVSLSPGQAFINSENGEQPYTKSTSFANRRALWEDSGSRTSSHQIVLYNLHSPPSYLDTILFRGAAGISSMTTSRTMGSALRHDSNTSNTVCIAGGSVEVDGLSRLRKSITDRDLARRLITSSSNFSLLQDWPGPRLALLPHRASLEGSPLLLNQGSSNAGLRSWRQTSLEQNGDLSQLQQQHQRRTNKAEVGPLPSNTEDSDDTLH